MTDKPIQICTASGAGMEAVAKLNWRGMMIPPRALWVSRIDLKCRTPDWAAFNRLKPRNKDPACSDAYSSHLRAKSGGTGWPSWFLLCGRGLIPPTTRIVTRVPFTHTLQQSARGTLGNVDAGVNLMSSRCVSPRDCRVAKICNTPLIKASSMGSA